ncbi:MAG: hypothetical protein WHT29_01665 [Bacteroidales bacterium]|nr:hypothetical protein [Bacteroidales bacterium]HOK99215.1 hypothetical protein [Bacteroidales bacterium]HPO66068.1 hypothetical protein [Bacteroidales bacterium]
MNSRILLIGLLICFSFSAIYAQKKKTVQEKHIKSVIVYNEDYEKNNGRQVKDSYTRFDEEGNVLEEIEYDEYGKEKKHVLYEYDKDGNKIKETNLTPKGNKASVIEYRYENGLKKEKIVYNGSGKVILKKKYVYEYH